MTYDPKTTADAPGANSPRGRQSRAFVVLIAVVLFLLLGIVVTFALHSSAFSGTHRPVPATSPGSSPQ